MRIITWKETMNPQKITDKAPLFFAATNKIYLFILLAIPLLFSFLCYFIYPDMGNHNADEAFFLAYSDNLSQGKLGSDVFGDLVGFNKIVFHFPPGYPLICMPFYWIFGLKVQSMELASLLIFILFLIYIYRKLKKNYGLAVLFPALMLLVFDGEMLFFAFMGRPETLCLLLYTMLTIEYTDFLKSPTLGKGILISIFSSLYIMTSIIGVCFVLAGLYSHGQKFYTQSNLRGNFISFSLVPIVMPMVILISYVLFFYSKESNFFWLQYLATKSFTRDYDFSQKAIRALLNPVADYAILFSHYSFFSIVLFFSALFSFIKKTKMTSYLPFFIAPHLFLIFSMRGSHYLIPLYGIGILFFADAFHILTQKFEKKTCFFLTIIIGILAIASFSHFAYNLTKDRVGYSEKKYAEIVENKIPSNSRILTSELLWPYLKDYGTIISITPLIWMKWRDVYAFDEIYKILNPDYILITWKINEYISSGHSQNESLKELLANEFKMIDKSENDNLVYYRIYERKKYN